MGTIPTERLNTITCADALDFTRSLPDQSVHCIVTSPPYFNVRDYGVDSQYGLEATPAAYVETLVTLFRECKRVLRDDGTFWLNIGDTYGRGSRGAYGTETLRGDDQPGYPVSPNLPEKNLLLIPHRLAIALQDDGWIVRQDNIWAKDAPMPESVQDRTTRAHEYIFHLVKQGDYYYDADAIREPSVYPDDNRKLRAKIEQKYTTIGKGIRPGDTTYPFRNKRSVWRLKSEPFSGPHYATFPSELPRTCILAGCPERCCPVCGAGWVREVEATGGTIGNSWHSHGHDLERGMMQEKIMPINEKTYRRIDKGFHPICTCGSAETIPGVVFDPFAGSGTTLLVARQLGRSYIGCDLSPQYVDIARDRLRMPFAPRQVKADNDCNDLPLFKTLTTP